MNQTREPNREGSATVEMAVVLPVLLFLIIAAFDLINAFIAGKKVDLSLYRAARMASMPGSTEEEIRQAALAEFSFIRSRRIDEYLSLRVHRNALRAEVSASIPVGKAAYLQPIFLRLGQIRRNYNRPIELFMDTRGIEILEAQPQPGRQGFNRRSG